MKPEVVHEFGAQQRYRESRRLTRANKVEGHLNTIGKVTNLMSTSCRNENCLTLYRPVRNHTTRQGGKSTNRILIDPPADNLFTFPQFFSRFRIKIKHLRVNRVHKVMGLVKLFFEKLSDLVGILCRVDVPYCAARSRLYLGASQ